MKPLFESSQLDLATRTRLLDRLYAALASCLLLALFIAVPFVVYRKLASSLAIVILLTGLWAAWRMSRQGQTTRSVTLISAVIWVLAVILLFFGSVPTVGFLVFAIAVIVAITVSFRSGVMYSVSFLLAWLGIRILGHYDILPPRYFLNAEGVDWILAAVSFFVLLVPMPDLVAYIQKARQQADAANAALRSHQLALEDTIAQRTAAALRAQHIAEQASAAKSRFLTNMSHEVRTPLHGMLSFAQLGLKRTAGGEMPDPEKLRQYFSNIIEAGGRLQQLLDNILTLTDMQSRPLALNLTALPVAEHLAHCIDQWRMRTPQAPQIDLHSAPTKLMLHADPQRLNEVITHLLDNAHRFASGSGIDVAIADATDSVVLRVSDHGPGIPAAERERVFEAFAESSRSASNAGGRGLGLAICRGILAAHGGSIHAEETAGGGCTMVVRLPLGS